MHNQKLKEYKQWEENLLTAEICNVTICITHNRNVIHANNVDRFYLSSQAERHQGNSKVDQNKIINQLFLNKFLFNIVLRKYILYIFV